MYPKTRTTRFILWLWKRYHCPLDMHIWSTNLVCDACQHDLHEDEEISEINKEKGLPEWACPNYSDEDHIFKDCYACMQNYNYFMENEE